MNFGLCKMATQDKMAVSQQTQDQPEDTVCFAELREGVVVLRINGRGTFSNSVELKNIADAMNARAFVQHTRFVVDLAKCSTMDSTFMGVLASIGLRQKKELGELMAVVNANPQSVRLLQTLGLSYFLEVRPAVDLPKVDDSRFHTPEHDQVDKVGQIIHMIEAHQCLCDVDSQNEVRFQSVLKYLNDSLKKERGE